MYAYEGGATNLAVSAYSGGIFNGDGLNIPDVLEYLKTNKVVKGYAKAQPISNEELLLLDCEALFPCALESQITEHNAEKIKAKMIVEGANGPTNNEATRILHRKGVFVVPDFIANGGGVVVSYFEWVQDLMSLFWDEEEINKRLQSVIVKAFDQGWKMSQEKNVDMRSAAMAVAIQRLEKAMLLRGLYPR